MSSGTSCAQALSALRVLGNSRKDYSRHRGLDRLVHILLSSRLQEWIHQSLGGVTAFPVTCPSRARPSISLSDGHLVWVPRKWENTVDQDPETSHIECLAAIRSQESAPSSSQCPPNRAVTFGQNQDTQSCSSR